MDLAGGIAVKYFVIGMFGLSALVLVSLLIGAVTLSPHDLFFGQSEKARLILFSSRVPRTISLVLAGASMAIAGSIMQMLSRNRFVEPGTAGTIESAIFGLLVVTLIAPGLPILLKMLVSVATALLGTALFLAVLERAPLRSPLLVPLVGLMLGGVINAAATFIAYRFDVLQSLVGWSTGDFSMVLRGRYELLWVSFVAAVAAYAIADRFTLAGLGQDISVNLGVNYRRTLVVGLGIVALVTASVVATVGAVPFVGLVVPNVVSMLIGDNVRRAVPWTALLGAAFVLGCDIVGRTIVKPYEIPLGSIVGVLGSAIFLLLLKRAASRYG